MTHSKEEPYTCWRNLLTAAISSRTVSGMSRSSLTGFRVSHITVGTNTPDTPDSAIVKTSSFAGGTPSLSHMGRPRDKEKSHNEAINHGIAVMKSPFTHCPSTCHSALPVTTVAPSN